LRKLSNAPDQARRALANHRESTPRAAPAVAWIRMFDAPLIPIPNAAPDTYAARSVATFPRLWRAAPPGRFARPLPPRV
jgi:hypothetical protein